MKKRSKEKKDLYNENRRLKRKKLREEKKRL